MQRKSFEKEALTAPLPFRIEKKIKFQIHSVSKSQTQLSHCKPRQGRTQSNNPAMTVKRK